MPDIIQLLPDSLANQIAAGEVIQRPASVVKELLENAVDAKAKTIKLILKDSGKTLIQVIDDGSGMTEMDARMSFERHATSKIKSTEDLFAIQTKGFRGEALASIAAVAKLELKTKQEQEELGVLLKVQDSTVVKQEPCQTPTGSNFSVRHLFFNVPARRKFLKSDPVELRHILDEFVRVALAHPDIAFYCYHNENKLHQLEAGSLRQRIIGIFNKAVNEKIIPVEEITDFIQINGFVGKPEFSKKTKGDQFFFVNNRFIKSAYLSHAVRFAFEKLIPDKHYPFFVIFITMDPKDVDINVHPTKQEVKFENERLIYNYIKVAIRHALGKYSIAPVLDFEQNVNYDLSHVNQEQGRKEGQSGVSSFIPSRANIQRGPSQQEINSWGKEYEALLQDSQEEDDLVILSSKMNADSGSLQHHLQIKAPLQLDKRFIISQIKSGLVVVDQQAAHERIIYERLQKNLLDSEVLTQQQLFPMTLELDVSQSEILNSILGKLKHIGFDVDSFGQNTFIIRGVPAHIDAQTNPKELIEQFLQHFVSATDIEGGINDKLCFAMAKSEAVKRGTVLQDDEMQGLIDQLFACDMPYKSPRGRKCFITITLAELDQKFQS